MDLLSRLDLLALGRDYVRQNNRKIDPGMVDVLGSEANVFVGSVSVVADALMKQLGYAINAQTLDGATGTDLDRYAFDRYQETRKGASPALGSVRIFRATSTAGAGTVPIGTSLKTLVGTEYVTTTTATFGASDLVTAADVRAAQAGKNTQVGANGIRKFSQPAILFDPTLQVNNDLPTAGGEDAEDDETFRNRIRNFWASARRGILAAIVQGATSVPGVATAQAIEALSGSGLPARLVNLYIADSSGIASRALAQKVSVALDDFRAGGIAVLVNTSIPLIVTVELSLRFRAGVDTVALEEQVRAAVVEFVNSLPVNGVLLVSGIYGVLLQFASDGLIADQGSVVQPAGDLVPSVNQTIRTTLANVIID